MVEDSRRARFLTEGEKIRHLAEWQMLRSRPFDQDAPGTPDPDIYDLVNRLNVLPGICVVQSCAGHRLPGRKAEGITVWPARLWLRLSKIAFEQFQEVVYDFLIDDVIEAISILYGRTEGPVVEVIFTGQERDQLKESSEVLYGLFRRCARGASPNVRASASSK